MATVQIAVINESKAVKDADAQTAMTALQKQVHRDFAPVWGVDANLTFVPLHSPPPVGAWWLVILENSDQAGELGYHDLTDEGLPLGKVFAGSDKQRGHKWTVTASHELLEMLGDPDIDLTVFVQSSTNRGTLYAYEVCDACEADKFGYDINGITVSDFVYPTWFESFHQPKSVQFDHRKHIQKPLQLLIGGYISVFDVSSGTGWQQKTAEGGELKYDMRARLGSRRERRRTPRDQWLKSHRR